MTPDQIEVVLSAARKILSGNRHLFDYLSLLTPVVGVVLGWMGAYLQFKASFRKGLEKEHYYASKQNVMEIIRHNGDFLNYLYEFYKTVKTSFSNFRPLPNDFFTDFITTYDFKLSNIDIMTRIEFPGKFFEIKPTTELLKELESHIVEMNEIIRQKIEKKEVASATVQDTVHIDQGMADQFSVKSSQLIDSIVNQFALQENQMVKLLSEEAARIGISNKARRKPKGVTEARVTS
jgi:hypothetical protein